MYKFIIKEIKSKTSKRKENKDLFSFLLLVL